MCAEREYILTQVHKIDIDKWVQGERQCSDPGERYIMEWIRQNAQKFREDWNNSCCKTCLFHQQCGFKTLSSCNYYSEDRGLR